MRALTFRTFGWLRELENNGSNYWEKTNEIILSVKNIWQNKQAKNKDLVI